MADCARRLSVLWACRATGTVSSCWLGGLPILSGFTDGFTPKQGNSLRLSNFAQNRWEPAGNQFRVRNNQFRVRNNQFPNPFNCRFHCAGLMRIENCIVGMPCPV
jgi:hypothetical protein